MDHIGAKYATSEENISIDIERMRRHARLSSMVSLVIAEACLTEEGTNLVLEMCRSLHQKIKEINRSKGLSTARQSKRTFVRDPVVINPSRIRTKGCGKRLKQSEQKSRTSKSRLCNGCGLRGVSHDKRNCPKLQDGSTTTNDYGSDVSTNEEDFGCISDGSYNTMATGTHLDE